MKKNMEKKFAELAIEEVEGSKVFVATDDTLDREGERIAIDGWRLDEFKRNPIILWSHNPMEPMIGKAENIRFRTINGRKKLTFEPVFHKLNEMSTLIAELVEKGWMKTVSVGFRPYQKEGDTFTDQELLEISFVNIPANPEATQLALSKGLSQDTVDKLFTNEKSEEVAETPEEKPETPEVTEPVEEKSMEMMDSMDQMMDDMPDDMKPMMKKTVKVMRDHEGRITEMEDMQKSINLLNEQIKSLGVATRTAKPAESLKSSLGQGRQQIGKSDVNKDIKRLMQVGVKAISKALELNKINE